MSQGGQGRDGYPSRPLLLTEALSKWIRNVILDLDYTKEGVAMTAAEQRSAAKTFSADWEGRGDEKQETALFWTALLSKVYGVAEPDKYISFEVPVKLDHTSFIDGMISSTHVLIEQKGADIDLSKGAKQSDGSVLTPYQQARRYAGNLPYSEAVRWIVV